MGTLATFLVACLFLSIYIPSNYGFSVGRNRRDADGTIEGLPSSWLTVGQVQEIKQTQESGQNFRDKYLEFFNKLDSEKKKVAGRQVVEKCYEWVKPVTSNEELLELSNLHHTDHEACKTKIKEYLGRVPDEQKEKIEKNLQICDDIWYKSHIEISAKVQNRHGSGQGHHGERVRRDESHDHGHVDHHGSHKLEDYFKNHLSWLTETQKEELKTLKTEGKSRKELQDKVFEYYEGTTGETKEKATELLRGGCKELLTTVIGPEKTAQLKQLKESGTAKDEIEKKVKEFIGEVTDPHKKQIAEEYEAPCKKLYGVGSRKKRDTPIEGEKLEEGLKTHLSWLTDDQKTEVRKLKDEGKSFEDVQKKVFEYYGALSGEAKDKATQLLQEGCRSVIKELVGEEKANELKTLRESGASKAELKNKIVALMDELTDPEKKEKAVKFASGCQKVFEIESARVKREHKVEEAKLEEALKTHLSWLTDDQKAEVKTLTSEGKSFEDVQKKVFEYYGALSGEAKDKATQLLQEGCRSLIKELVGEEKANELKKLRESGASKTELKNKIVALMDELTDPEKKEKAVKFAGGCQKVFEVDSARVKRDTPIEGEKLEEGLKTHLSWLTDDQKTEVRKLKDEGKSFEDVQKKVFEYYGALSGEAKDKATQLLQEGCRSLIKELVGEEKANELKTLRESGASKTELKNKIVALMDELTDPVKKEKAVKFASGCQKVFEIESARVKRDNKIEDAKFEEALTTHLSWLTDDQKEQLKTLKSEGKSFEDVQKKVFEFYGALSGESKTKATELLQEGCRSVIKDLVGEEKANELKKLRESGASKTELKEKIVKMMDELTDPEKKEKALKFAGGCQKVFEIDEPKRKKRDHHVEADKLQEALNTHLSWLTDEQKSTLKTLQSEGKSFTDLNDKVFEWYGQLSGEAQQKAKELLQGGCRALIKELAGDEKAEELKKLRESGASKEEIKNKVVSFLDALTDEDKKKKALKYAPACQKIFDLDSARVKRDEGQGKLEEAFKTHLSWLNEDQKQELRSLKNEGKEFSDMQTKVFGWYEALSGEEKEKATELLKGGCRHLMTEILGEEKAGELKKLKESGTSKDDLKAKVSEFINALTDEEKKAKAQQYAGACEKIFGVSSRKKRGDHDHHGHIDHEKRHAKLEEYFKTHLSWLTDAQKQTLNDLCKQDKTDQELQAKVFEFYEALTGEAKEKATQLLQDGCRALIKSVLGDEKAAELKKLKESGATKETIETKVQELIAGLEDGEKKKKAQEYGPVCKKIFGVSRKKRSSVDAEAFEKSLQTSLSWLTDAQKDQLRNLKNEGKSFEDLEKKTFEFYGELSGEAKQKAAELMKDGCRALIKEIVGEEKANEIKKLKESGATKKDIKSKVVEFMDEVTDPAKKEKATKYAGSCMRIFELEEPVRVKRDTQVDADNLDKAVKTHLSWLTDDQKAEVKKLTSEGKSFEDVQKKVFEYYGALSGEAKDKATQLLQEGCRSLIKELVGEEKANELKTLRESGASKTELKNKIVALMDELTDPAKKEKAVKFASGCQKVFEIESARVKREHKVEEAKLEEALKTHLSWLTDDQKAEVKTLTSEGKSFEDVQKKVFEYYGALSGEAKDKATQLLQEGCRSLIKELVGEEKANELKKLRESGASKTELKNKIVALMDELTDPEKKEKAVKFAGGCQKVFEVDSARVKREHKVEEAKLEEALKTHLSWLSDDQKAEVKKLTSEGKSFEDVQKKVFEYYGALSGEAKDKATQLLQEGCRSLIKELVGEEKANELKKLRESGASKTELKNKIVALMDELTDPEKKEKAVKFAGGCQKVFEVDSARVKREHKVEGAKLEEALKTHLSWLTDDQKAEVKTLTSEGKSFEDVQKKVFEYYGALSGEAKDKATQLLQEGCRSLIKELVGEEKANELKKLRESGASKTELKNKIVALMDELTDPEKKEKAVKFAGGCQKVFEVDSARVKRDNKIEDAKFEEALTTHLSWLTDDQKEQLKTLKSEGKSFEDVQKKVFEFYGALSGESKTKATELLQEGCRSVIKDLVGEEKANELKKLRESGASKTELKEKIVKLMDELTDPEKKEKALKFAGGCQKVFEIDEPKRKKRDHHVEADKLQEALNTHLSWLTDEQKSTLKTLQSEGKSFTDLNDKVFEWYGQLSGEAQQKAKELLQGGCRALIKELAGDEKAEELKKLRESGASKEEIKSKVVSFLDALTDEDKKKKALKYAPACQKIFDLDA